MFPLCLILPLCIYFGEKKGGEKQGSRGLTYVLCLHPLLILVLFVAIYLTIYSTGLHGCMLHYGEVCHINSSTKDCAGHSNVYGCSYTQTHEYPETHTSQTR